MHESTQGQAQRADTLAAHHRRMLEVESGIDPAVIAERGYSTITKKVEAASLGFSSNQQRNISKETPALVLPLRWTGGAKRFAMLRLDDPRIKGYRSDGRAKIVKYEIPVGIGMALDSPPRCHRDLGDPSVPLIVGEGIKKGDAGASRGGCWLTLLGVYNWRGANGSGGKATLPEWEDVALNGRRVYIAFDSDAMTKLEVYRALSRLREWLVLGGAKVYVIYLPPLPGGKCGVDDWFVADPGRTLGDLLGLAEKELRKPEILARHDGQDRVSETLPDWPQADEVIVPQGYDVDESEVVAVSVYSGEDGEPVEKRRTIALAPLYISGLGADIETGDQQVTLCFRGPDGLPEEITVTRDVVAEPRKLVQTALKGVPVTSNHAPDVVQYLAEMEAVNCKTLPRQAGTLTIGWQGKHPDRVEQGFLYGTDHIVREDSGAAPISYNGEGGERQRVEGYRTDGSEEAWRRAVGVLPHFPRLLLPVYVSFAAVLLDILRAPNIIYSIAAPSSTGKTVAMGVIASIYGNPNANDPDSLIRSWADSVTFAERVAERQPGLPLLMDETKRLADPENLGGFLFGFSNGQTKGRGRPGGIQPVGVQRGVLITTGETPITALGTKEHGGLHARVLEVWGSPLGTGRDEGEKRKILGIVNELQRACADNYGYAGRRYVRYLVDNRAVMASSWRERYVRTLGAYQARVGAGVEGRLCQYLAAVDTAAYVAHESGALPWDYSDPVVVLWDQLLSGAGGADKACAAYHCITAWAARNQTSFWLRHREDQDGKPYPAPGGFIGTWPEKKSYVTFDEAALRRELIREGYSADILQQWHDRGWTVTNRGRKNLRVSINGEKVRHIALRLDVFDDEDEKTEER